MPNYEGIAFKVIISKNFDGVVFKTVMLSGAKIMDSQINSESTWSSEHLAKLLPKGEASGSIATFDDGAGDVPLISCVAEFSASQASGTPTPSAPIPIVGVDKVNFTRCGKNLLAKSFDYYSSVGTNLSDYFFIKAGTYRFSFDTSTAENWRFVVRMKDKDGNDLSSSEYQPRTSGVSWSNNAGGWLNTSNLTSKSLTYTFVSDCYIRILFGYGNTSSSTTMTNAQLEIGETATEYEPYNGTTALINLGGTYYGGSVDAVTGKITLTHVKLTETKLRSFNWSIGGTNNNLFGAIMGNEYVYPTGANEKGDILSDIYENVGYTTINTATQAYQVALRNDKTIRIKDDRYATLQDFKNDLGNLNIVVKLATPIVVYASNTAEITTIVGDNQVFADSGDVALKYFLDIKKYIDNLVNPSNTRSLSNGLNLTREAPSIPDEVEEEEEESQETNEER